MNKLFLLIVALCACLGLMSACGQTSPEAVAQETTTQPVEESTIPQPETTEPTVAPFRLEIDVTELSLTTIGQKVTIYSGEIPANRIYWYSADSAVAAIDCGVITAMGSGVANVYGVYKDQTVHCTVTSTAEYNSDPTPLLAAPDYEYVDASFFDDAVFVGDSISVKLFYGANGRLGNAQFLVQTSYGLHNAVNDVMYTSYRGQTYRNLEDAIAATGAKKLFIMLGINDVGRFGLEENMENWRILVELIRETCPDIQIYIQSLLPMWKGAETRKLNNSKINAYNFALCFFAEQYGCGFIDVYPYLQAGTGGLVKAFSSDKYVHITEAGVDTWISALKAYANYLQE